MANSLDSIAQQTPPVFGDRGPGIFGIKFVDNNADGIRQPNETEVLSGITFLLEPAATANGTFNAPGSSTGEAVVTSGPNGLFQFLNVAPGNYRLTETNVPPGAIATTPNPLPVTVSNRDVNVLFGNSVIAPTVGSGIVGCKYLDIDGDGFRDGNEPGIKNVRIYIDANNDGNFSTGEQSTFSDQNGNWRLNVAAGTYRVREERVNGVNTEPLETNFRQSTPPGNIPVLDVTVLPGQVFACAQIGNAPLYEIPLRKFRDLDNNGRQNTVTNFNGFTGLEPAIDRVPFIIDLNRDGRYQADEPILITDVNGQGVFRNLPAGNYSVLEIFPSVLPAAVGGGVPGNIEVPIGSTPNPLQVSAPGSGARFQGSISEAVPLRVPDAGYTRTGANIDDPIVPAGQRPIFVKQTFTLPATNPQPSVIFTPVGANTGLTGGGGVGNTRPNISVFKYNDLNGNGVYEPARGETGRNGVQVFIDTNGDGQLQPGEPVDTTKDIPAGQRPDIVTAGERAGRALFSNLAPGNYTVQEVAQQGLSPSTPARVSFSLNNQDANVSFGNTPNSRITGCKFEDFNQNGYRDGNEPGIAGTTIYIDVNGDNQFQQGVDRSTTSAADGTWSFNDLTPGTYRVREVAPPGFFQTTQPLDIILGANQEFGCALVGNARRYDLRVPKFRDDNRNGVRDNNEPPLANIPFTLDFNRNGSYDAATEPLVRTDANGIALFPDLFPGTYAVLEVFQAGVPNEFPIPTGPNPVNFSVPGPNTVTSPPRTTPTPVPATTTRAGGTAPGSSVGEAVDFITGMSNSAIATTPTSSAGDELTDGGGSGDILPTQPKSGFDIGVAPDIAPPALKVPFDTLSSVEELQVFARVGDNSPRLF